ncbi:hypothetical protein [Salmonella phage PT1]|nr:hypothetical protein [Salmonella phage PT1]
MVFYFPDKALAASKAVLHPSNCFANASASSWPALSNAVSRSASAFSPSKTGPKFNSAPSSIRVMIDSFRLSSLSVSLRIRIWRPCASNSFANLYMGVSSFVVGHLCAGEITIHFLW